MLKFLLALTGLVILIAGIYDIFLIMEENGCEMTYMFEYPLYIQLHIPAQIQRDYPRYSLVFYDEGENTGMNVREKRNGIPVLFIPGNAGSAKQVRSLGSVALRKTEGMSFHFNYFAVDFNEELSALKGDYLANQTRFVHECLKVILGLDVDSVPSIHKSVIVIGHSMGGVIATGLFALKDFQPSMIHTIITLATPHLEPAFLVDAKIARYYGEVRQFWKMQSANSSSVVKNLVVASIGGGSRDVQVRSDLTSLDYLFHGENSFSVITTAIPKVWVSTDHLCIVWCKQLVLAITRTLIDMVDLEKSKIYTARNKRIAALKYHLVSSFSSRNSLRDVNAKMLQRHQRDFSQCKLITKNRFRSKFMKNSCFFMDISERNGFLAAMYEGEQLDWIGSCKSAENCNDFVNLIESSQVIPSKAGQGQVFLKEISELKKKGRFIFFYVSKESKDKLSISVFDETENTYVANKPWFFGKTIIALPNQRTFTKVLLPFMKVPWMVYNMVVDSSCKNPDASVVVNFHIPWFREDTHKVCDGRTVVPLKFSSHPQNHNISSRISAGPLDARSENDSPVVRIWLESKCNVTLELSLDIVGSIGQALRYSYESILKWVAALSLIWLFSRAKSPDRSNMDFANFACLTLTYEFVFRPSSDFMLITIQLLICSAVLSLLVAVSLCIKAILSSIGERINAMTFGAPRRSRPSVTDEISKNTPLEVLSLTCLSITLCSTAGILALQVTFFVRLLIVGQIKTRCLFLTFVMLILNAPNLVCWFKDLEHSYKATEDFLSVMTSVSFIFAMYAVNFCEDGALSSKKVYGLMMHIAAFSVKASNEDFRSTSFLFCAGILTHCVCTKKELMNIL